jgi:hypothetical protein
MTRHIIGRAAFSGAVAVALVFGARAAAAEPAPREAAAASCTAHYQCADYCRTYYGWMYTPKCYGGRCECVLL